MSEASFKELITKALLNYSSAVRHTPGKEEALASHYALSLILYIKDYYERAPKI